MDAFYARSNSATIRRCKGKPVAVGGGHRGVVAAASYEARTFGVRSAMPSVTAKRRCPELVFVKPRFDVYRAVSQPDPRDLRRLHRSDRAVEPRRSLSRRERGPPRARQRPRHRRGYPRPHRGGDRADRVGRGQLLQVHRQAGVGPEQARRHLRHPAGARRGFRRHAAGQALPRRRPGHRARRWSGSASSPAPTSRLGAARARGAFRQLGRLVLAHRRGIDERAVQARPAYKSVSAERTFDRTSATPTRWPPSSSASPG